MSLDRQSGGYYWDQWHPLMSKQFIGEGSCSSVPSGKRLHNYGSNHHARHGNWENSRTFDWAISPIATQQSLPDGKSHKIPFNHYFPMVFLWFSIIIHPILTNGNMKTLPRDLESLKRETNAPNRIKWSSCERLG